MINKEKRKRRKKFLEKLNEYIEKRNSKKLFEEQYFDISSDGVVHIPVRVEDSPFSSFGGRNDLSPELIEYIESTAYSVPVDRPLSVEFTGIAGEDEADVEKAYRKYFDLKLADKCLDHTVAIVKSVWLLGIGILFLGLSVLFANVVAENFLYEILAVIASFSLWESVDFFLLERVNAKTEKLDAAQLLLADLKFFGEQPMQKETKEE